MNIRLNRLSALLATMAGAGILMTACDNATAPGRDSATVSPAPDKSSPQAGGTGLLKEPLIPTAEQIRLLESKSLSRSVPQPPQSQPEAQGLAKTAGTDYNVNFNDPNALYLISDQAYTSVAPFYISQVRSGVWAYVLPYNDGHFHLGYENPNDCFVGSNGFLPSGKYGILSGSNCILQGNAATQARYLNSHEASAILQTYVWDGSTRYVFDLKSIYLEPNGGNAAANHAQIWIHKIDVGWRYWADLGSGTGGFTWYFPQTGVGGAQGIDEVQILSPTTSYPVAYDNMVINVH